MNLLRKRRRTLFGTLLVLLVALVAGPVLAGGWAVITLDELPGEIHAGENIHLSFMVRQHGKEPVHFLGDSDIPVEPVISGTNVETGERIEIAAVVDESEVGRFYADVVFPSEGEWRWEIAPNPLVGTTELAPLMILPELNAPASNLEPATDSTAVQAAAPAAPVTNTPDMSLILRGAAVLLLAAGAMMFLAGRRKDSQPAAVVEAGD